MGSKILREGERYKAQLNKTLKDGKVTSAEVDGIIKDAKSGKLQEVDGYYLAGFLDHAADKFDPEARKKLANFVAVDMPHLATIQGDQGLASSSTAQPKFTAEDSKAGAHVDWAAHPGQLVVGGISADDPEQGNVGDCYFISSLAAVAKSHPEVLQKAITANANGTYTVTFHERKPGETSTKPVQVTIDGKLPTKSGSLEYAVARNSNELWPMLFEKAYAQWKGSYDAIEGGMGDTALEALTGAQGDFHPVTNDSKPAEVFAQLKAGLANGGCVVACSKPWDPATKGVIGDHAYTVLAVRENNGQQEVQLRNPWGQTEPGHDGSDDGVFWLSAADFVKNYTSIEAVHP